MSATLVTAAISVRNDGPVTAYLSPVPQTFGRPFPRQPSPSLSYYHKAKNVYRSSPIANISRGHQVECVDDQE
jgi:hypothetical protein